MGKKFLSLAMFLVFMMPAAAQHWQLKVGGGFASQYSDKKAVGSFKFGVGYEYELGQRWAINPSLIITQKGWKDKDVFVHDVDDETGENRTDENGNEIMSRMGRSTSGGYIELPVMMNYYIRTKESQYLVVGAGPYVACGIWGKQETKGDGRRQGAEKLYYEHHTFNLSGSHRFDAGFQGMIGYQLPRGITISAEADFGMVKVQSEGGRNISGLISLTYTFKK